jgi:hypothetical protein
MFNLKNKQMNKKMIYVVALCATIVLPVFTGCSKEKPEDPKPEIPKSEYLYVLNSGNMGRNDATLSIYDVETKVVTKDIFEAQNGRRLGDTGNDIIVYGSKIYIVMNGENNIEVTDLAAKSIRQLSMNGGPRNVVGFEGNVYVSLTNGFVARIDTATFTIERLKVGRSPEQMVVVNGNLYVANSGGLDFGSDLGYDNTVSVVNLQSFKETKKLDVALNPTVLAADKAGNIFVISMGNYYDIPVTLQKIDTKTDQVSVLEIEANIITTVENTLYAINAPFFVPTVNYYAYNTTTNSLISDNFIGKTNISNPYQMSSDPESGEFYITASDYVNTGDIYVFDKNGKFSYSFEAGLNPIKVIKIKR